MAGSEAGDRPFEDWRGAAVLSLATGVAVWTVFLVRGWRLDRPTVGWWLGATVVLTCAVGVPLVAHRLAPFVLPCVATMLALALTGALPDSTLATRTLATVVAWVVVAVVVAREWERPWLRVAVALLVVATLALAVKVGRAELAEERVADARAAATALDRERVASRQVAADALIDALEERSGAVDVAVAEVAVALGGGSADGLLPPCPAPPRAPDGELCAALELLAPDRSGANGAGVTEVDEPETEDVTATATDLVLQADVASGPNALQGRAALVEEVISATEAVEAAEDVKVQVRAGSLAARNEIGELCTLAGGTPTLGHSRRPCPAGEGPLGTTDDLEDASARAEAAVADLAVVAQGPGDGREDALDAAQAAQNLAEASGAPAESAALDDLVVEGAEAVVSTLPLLGGGHVPVALTVVGWSLLGGLAIAGYRRLEIANARVGQRSVSFRSPAGARTGEEDTGEVQSLFRRYVLENAVEPGALPGATASLAFGSFTEVRTDPASKLVAALLKAVQDATASRSGYEVEATYHAPEAGSEHEIFVRVLDGRTGATRAQHTSRSTPLDLAVREAAYWAAAAVASQDRRVPSWSRWTVGSSLALAAYDRITHYDAEAGKLLDDAIRVAPTSGLLLLRLANQKDIDGSRLEALELLTRCCTIHPRYPQARYRLAASLAMVAGTHSVSWPPADPTTTRRLTRSLRRCAKACEVMDEAERHIDDLDPDEPEVAAEARQCLLSLAAVFVTSAERLLQRRSVARNALRRSERAIWLPMLVWGSGRRRRGQASETVRAARSILAARGTPGIRTDPAVGRFEAWQALYNLACAAAIRGTSKDRRDAVELLERALEAPGAQLSRQWLDADPDLTSLRQDAGFSALRARVQDQEEVEEASA